jgi:restriction endonuclease S subunit
LKATLKDIANIQTGVFAKTVVEGDVVYLQAKHFDEDGILNYNLKPDLQANKLTERHLLRHKDILFAAKGSKNFAALYESKNFIAVASTSFFVIRLHYSFEDKILPEYLTWFINHPSSQKFLKGRAIGTSMVSISKSVLEELEVSIPDLKMQTKILNVFALRNKERILKQQIEALKDRQLQQQILNVIK